MANYSVIFISVTRCWSKLFKTGFELSWICTGIFNSIWLCPIFLYKYWGSFYTIIAKLSSGLYFFLLLTSYSCHFTPLFLDLLQSVFLKKVKTLMQTQAKKHTQSYPVSDLWFFYCTSVPISWLNVICEITNTSSIRIQHTTTYFL